jgi:hypothetical protein
VTALLRAARLLHDRGQRPAQDVYLVFTTNEEIGGVGGSYASATLPGTLTIALEVGPTEREYATTVTGGPIIGYSDALCVYDKDVADQLMHIAIDRGLTPQPATLGAFMSDASHSKASGLTPRAGLLCLPTLSTHGFEVIPRAAIEHGRDRCGLPIAAPWGDMTVLPGSDQRAAGGRNLWSMSDCSASRKASSVSTTLANPAWRSLMVLTKARGPSGAP